MQIFSSWSRDGRENLEENLVRELKLSHETSARYFRLNEEAFEALLGVPAPHLIELLTHSSLM